MQFRWWLAACCVFGLACSGSGDPAAADDVGTGGESDGGAGHGIDAAGAASSGGGATTSGGGASSGHAGGSGPGSSPSAGCGNNAAAEGSSDETIQVAGKTRTYVLSVPAKYEPATAIPVVFTWHGRGASGAYAKWRFGFEEQSSGGAIFVYPDGLPVDGGKTGWDLKNDGEDVQFFDAMLAALDKSHCIDKSRVFSAGHSYGGYMTNTLGCARANVLRGIAPIAGGGPYGSCVGGVAAWITHGASDPTVLFSEGESSRDHWLNANGCANTTSAVSPAACVKYDGCGATTPLHWCRHEGDHGRPSFAAEGIWGFFSTL